MAIRQLATSPVNPHLEYPESLARDTIRMSTVTAIVSTYNAERFLRGCLDDLLTQTLTPEIVIVNAGSKQDEAHILREYLERGVALKIITSLREPLYTSWNRAIRLATGDYIVPANTDDRFRPDALEVMAGVLDSNSDAGLVYADSFAITTENATWNGDYKLNREPPYQNGKLEWPDFDPLKLLQYCYVGPRPMWRRALHEQFGLFDESFLLAGDFEWALRLVANGVRFQHIPDTLSLFLVGGMGMHNQQQSAQESYRAVLHWRAHIMELECG